MTPTNHAVRIHRRPLAVAATVLVVLLGMSAVAQAKPPWKRKAPDTTPPETTITGGPTGTITTTSASFSFSASESDSTFQCRLDDGAFSSCSSPKSYSALGDGTHSVSVRAIDRAGNADATPAARSFVVEVPASESEPPESGAVPTTWRRSASFETSLNEGTQFGWTIQSPFSVTRSGDGGARDGAYATKIVTNGGSSGCSCPRMGFEDGFSYGPGREVWISGAWRIPDPSKVAWSRLMNLGHYEGSGGDNWYLALESTNPGTFQVSHAPYGSPNVAVLPARPIPANRWFQVDLHFKLSPTDGQALTEWYIDGQLVGSSTKANMRNSKPLHFYHAGLPYFWPGNGNTTVYFDAARLTEVN
jgi:hypothetical protein